MGCNELLQLLQSRQAESKGRSEAVSTSDGSIMQHMRTCLYCRHGLARLSAMLPESGPDPVLACDQCLALLPTYYEATHPDHPLVDISERALTDVVQHMSSCDTCSEVYEELVALAVLEERNDFEL